MNICQNLFCSVGMDVVVVLSPSNTLYLSGYNSTNCQIILTKETNYFVTDLRYYFEAKNFLKDKFTVLASDGTGLAQLAKIVSQHNAKSVGWDSDISYKEYILLKAAFSEFKNFVDISEQISQCRDIKQNEEIAKIKKAQAVTDSAFDYILTQIKQGVTEVEIAAKLEYFILKNNCQFAFDTIVAFGKNTSSPHAHRTLNKLEQGQFVTMDFGAKCDGYCSDMTRTVALGNVSSEFEKIYFTVLTAQELAINNIKAKMKSCECDAIARNYIKSCGYGEYFTHTLGHGVGIDIHEGTGFSSKSQKLLQENMVVSVEPGIYIEGLCGVRIEDMVVVGKQNVVDLTQSNKKLIIL